MATRRCIVIGLGNPILGDDGVGWRIADRLAPVLAAAGADSDVDRASVGGLGLMERLVGYDRAVIVDALRTRRAPVGSVRRFRLESAGDPTQGHLGSAHDVSLATALATGRSLGAHLPSEITIVGVEVPPVDTFSDVLTPEVAAAVPVAVAAAARAVLDDPLAPGGPP